MAMNKPVAWMSKEDFEDYLSEDKKVTSATVFNFKLDIPLYTHPVKELTDEEIGQIWKDCMETPYMQVNNPVGFAKTILRKASEK